MSGISRIKDVARRMGLVKAPPGQVAVMATPSGSGIDTFSVPGPMAPDANLAALLAQVGVSTLWLGASITFGTGTTNASTQAYSALAGRSVINRRKAWGFLRRGYASQTSSYILGQAEAQIQASRPRCVIAGPDFFTNDIEQSVPDATSRANIEALRQLCIKYGVRLEVCKTLPMGSAKGATKAGKIGALNHWLSIYCALHRVTLHDTFTPMADPATGYLLASLNSDDVHPNIAGHQALADAISPNCMADLGIMPWPVTALGGGGLVPAGYECMTTLWTNVTGTATATLALEAPATGTELISGQWMTAALSAAGFRVVGKGIGTLGDGTMDAGDKLLICGQYSVTASLGTKSSLALYKGSSTLIANLVSSNIETPQNIMETYTLQATDTGTLVVGMQPTCAAGETMKARAGGVGVLNLTKLGIADLFG